MCWCGSGIQLIIRRRAMFPLNKKRMLQKNTDALNQAAEASHWPPATPAISLHWCLHWNDFAWIWKTSAKREGKKKKKKRLGQSNTGDAKIPHTAGNRLAFSTAEKADCPTGMPPKSRFSSRIKHSAPVSAGRSIKLIKSHLTRWTCTWRPATKG